MDKKICVITGANSGIGKAAAVQIAQAGHQVIMACRNQARGEAALQEVRQQSKSDDVALMLVDMSLQSSIRQFAAAFLAKYSTLDVLIHNAAAFDVRQKRPVFTEEGIESIWATNHLGPVFLTKLLLDPLKNSRQGRVLLISSKGLIMFPFLRVDLADPEFRRRKFSVTKAYYQSKLAQVMYMYWLVDELQGTAVTVNAIRVTNVKIDIDSRYPNTSKLSRAMYRLKSKFSITPEEMAQTYTHLALSDELSQVTGTYFDDPRHIVKPSKYSRDKENINQLMQMTFNYWQTAESNHRAD